MNDIIELVSEAGDNQKEGSLSTLFANNEIYFKIESTNDPAGINTPIGIVETRASYMKRRDSHKYTPLLYTCDFYTHLAYVYGCLNTGVNVARRETFIFLWRTPGTKEWRTWFIVHPYTEIVIKNEN